MKLEWLLTFSATLEPPVVVGAVPLGTRTIHNVNGGTFEGPKLRGRVLPGGGDWLLTDASGTGRLDVRAALETDDGAQVYVQYYGVLDWTPEAREKLASGGSTEIGEVYFMTQPRFETGDERYAWLNKVVAVAEGRIISGGVEYRVYHVVND